MPKPYPVEFKNDVLGITRREIAQLSSRKLTAISQAINRAIEADPTIETEHQKHCKGGRESPQK